MMFHSKQAGFTLIELLIVLVLIGLASAFVLPDMWKQFDQTKYYSEKNQLAESIKFAKYYSVYKGETLELRFYENHLEIVKQNSVKADPETQENTEQVETLKRVDFSSLKFEDQKVLVNVSTYFDVITVKFKGKDKAEHEVLEV
ncbi:prepilin-type N-terminal cleavage/methylation domain-containing protein [Pseudoalteromonas lipolytica]|uniref:Prepilin-type N-terminal cleavage/methylation domain-containing protein n=1 Tax=Pseudoalteromonas lipolytica TaxID=570156 RepID=A0ABY1GIE0_9GAMM|nr:prepilin-type N-terminal cleavage/methylation domain-containing protein [Pseudoalteromonas lipolytica]MBE0349615.1 hypothetical protein [Pseudoalteromonas lipolytica LMEB 39]SFT78070.1 prepilin-type N-terminal cleavage/methylation domain-containing protein [Pseudoalteromonas lipolytica]